MTSRIAELATTINSNTLKVHEYLGDNGLPFPSFAADAPLDLKIQSAEVQHSRQEAINAALELVDLLQGPVSCAMPKWDTASLQAIQRFGLPDKVPLEGNISYKDLAEKSGLHPHDLQQIIRHAMAWHRLFTEPEVGFVAHSAGSKALAQNDILRANFGMQYDFFYKSFHRTSDALAKYQDKEPDHTAFTLAFETKYPLFKWLESNPRTQESFIKAMTGLSQDMPGFSEKFLVNGYDWSSLGSATVVDVGGSDGYVSKALAKQYPSLNFIVQDLPQVVNPLIKQAGGATTADRVQLQGHDFFTPQTVVADAYLFRWILHDWPDHYVERALKNLIPALRPGARVILNESLCPIPGTLPIVLERGVRAMDLDMLSLNNSRLRTVDEWNEIFSAADSRFGKVKCTMPEGASLAIMEVIWLG